MIEKILEIMGQKTPQSLSSFKREEDGEDYGVWKLEYPDKTLVLKRAKGREYEIYRSFLMNDGNYAPKVYGFAAFEGKDYLLMEYIPGQDLMRCARDSLTKVLDSLIRMQNATWNGNDPQNSFEAALKGRQNRANYLHDQRLERAYDAYLQEFNTAPRTLCHDDLLPFNVIVNQSRAVFIDWEVGGMLPYPTSLARLIAHTSEDESAFFYMKDEDKAYAINYYYDHLIKGKGIGYDAYRRSLNLCLFYEYCEWVFVGYKYNATDSDRFRQYMALASNKAFELGY